jgi:hypothetical protein
MSTSNFNKAFFSYDDKLGLQPVLGAGQSQCPPGRILRENGRKLYPGVNTNIKTIMTGVYDSVTLLSGFIDVNSGIFTLYAIKHAPEQPDGLDYNPRGIPSAEGVEHRGQSVFTHGDVVAGGQFYATKTIDLGNAAFINGDFSATSYYSITLTQNTQLNALIVPPHNGTVIYLFVTGNGSSTLTLNINFNGSTKTVTPKANEKIPLVFISDTKSLFSIGNSSPGVVPLNYQVIKF